MATDAARPRWRTELPFLVTLGAAAAIRVVVALAFPPAFLMSDGPTYLTLSDSLTPSPDRPIGYSIFLRGLSDLTRSLVFATSVQLVLGLLTAVTAYALLRRWGVGPWIATLAAAPTLFDSMQLLLEHAILSDVLFGVLMMLALAALAWWPTPRWWTTVLAGALLGLATLVRILGEPSVVLAAVFLLVVATSWRTRVLHVVLVLAAFAVPVTSYAVWYHHDNGRWGITEASGRALYMRTTTFVDCRTLEVPAYERVLCPVDPLGRRLDPTWYGWHSFETIPRLHPPPGVTKNQALRDFAVRAIEAQPLDYLRDVGRDSLLAFVAIDRRDHYEMQTSVKWTFAHFDGYQPTDWTGPSFDVHGGVRQQTHQPMADVMSSYGRHVFVPGPLSLALVVLAAVGIVVRRREQGPSVRPLALLTLALSLMLVLIPDVTAQFVWRYQLPLVTLLPLAAALAWTRLRTAHPVRRGVPGNATGETPVTRTAHGAQPGTRATASTD
jgi:4-amino-4-deoxy-L-arabinose transferase-like glycosyltransferase